ncbi:Flp family type IVb pilin [Desulfobacca acetoxidans]|uniref:Flp/Fap pilin component n=1 Tax=Desulfobacca acetoxidans (strain ATCC 700848 / DSM 11109 / ASRB2) TaxID=880072 RepID=F2NFB6_DESAR|nr:Flp/Fap pilin component [Desulfobacca acetoxidans DSM 11109]HAY20717.1 Flp family type IVb pilin [Desulfobacterales bacterium]
MTGLLISLWRDEAGATAIEYGLIVGIMAATLITALGTFSEKLESLFSAINTKLSEAESKVKGEGT